MRLPVQSKPVTRDIGTTHFAVVEAGITAQQCTCVKNGAYCTCNGITKRCPNSAYVCSCSPTGGPMCTLP